MDSNNWRPNQGQGTEPTMDTGDWRAQLHPDSRQRVVNKIMDTLKKHLPVSGPDGLSELQKIAQRFEEKIFCTATNQPDYLRKISLKMLTMETKSSQNIMANNMSLNQVGGPSNKPPDQGLALQPQVHIPGQQHPSTLPNQQPQGQQLLSQNIPNNDASQPNLQPVSSLAQTSSQNIGQSSNMQNIPGQNSVGNTVGQISHVQDMLAGSQRQIPGMQQVVPQQQQQPQNSQQYLYQQQLMKHKLQLQSQIQQQRQQNLLQPNQLQPSMMQTSPLSSLRQNQQPNKVQQSSLSMLQQHSQVIRQQQQQSSIMNQQQTSMSGTNTMLSAQQQQQPQQLMGLQSNATSMQHAQMLGPQNNVGDMQQPQRLLSQKNNLANMQQRQQQQQLLNQQSNLANMHQQQLGNSVPGLRQQQLVGPESGNSGMQTNQHSHMLQQTKVLMQQQAQQNASLLSSQAQQSQPQGAQQQLMPQVHAQPAQLQQQLGLQKQPNPLQRDMQQRLQSSSLIQQQHDLDQQKQIYQSQRALPETSASSLDSAKLTAQPSGGDEQEEVYQKVKAMKESYLADLSELYQRISPKLQQYESLPQQIKSEQFDKLKIFVSMIERLISFLKLPKNNLPLGLKEKLGSYEKQIINVLSSSWARRSTSSTQIGVGQLPPSHASIIQPQSQVVQVQSHENQMNSQLQPSNISGSVATVQQNNNASLQHNSMTGVSAGQQNMNSMQAGTNLDSGQGDSMNSLQQVPMSSLQPNSVSTSQQTNINPMSSQGGVNVVQQNLNTLQSGSSMLQNQKMKHHQEQQMLQNQQFKQQFQQRLLMQRQQMLQQQQLHQPAKQQLSAMQTHQMQQLHQMNDINDMKMRQGMGVKQGMFQQHLTSGQHSAYTHQQSKQGGPFHVSSPQLLQAASPQIPQHSSPQVEQQNHLPSLAKVATPLQHSNSPFVGPTPSPPLAPSPMAGDSDKPISTSIGHQMAPVATPAQSLAIGTPGISASPLLAECSCPDGAQSNALADTSGKSTVTEEPIERLVRVLKSMSPQALSAAVSDIGSVVSMNDRIAGSGPANGSRAAVGEDLVSVTSCRLQARNSTTQHGINRIRKMKRYVRAIPSNVASAGGGMNDIISQPTASGASDMDSTASSTIKKPKMEVNHALLEEIREINNRLIDTAVDVIDEDTDPAAAAKGAEGTIVKCSYKAVALSPSLKAQYARMSPIEPLSLLVPANYPNCSPIFLDNLPIECSEENEDLSARAKSKFSISLRCLKQPMSLMEIAKTWDKCTRGAVSDYAQKRGGGTFSSKYGGWEDISSFGFN